MPSPEFVSLPAFFKFRCSNTDSANCPACPREFAIQSSMIESVFKSKDGHAFLLVQGIHYCPSPACGAAKYQIIETKIPYEKTLEFLDGKIVDFGDIVMNSNVSIQVNG